MSYFRTWLTHIARAIIPMHGEASFFAPLVLIGAGCVANPHRLAGQEYRLVTLDGIIHADSDDTLAFTPDGNTVFFDRSEGTRKTILTSSKVQGHWTNPTVASFSGQWFDQDPVVSPDGTYMLFNSDRPVVTGGVPLTQNYFVGGKAPGSNLWRVNRAKHGWGAPVWLGPIVNNDVFVDFASVAKDGTLYFIRWDSSEKAMHIWRSRSIAGRYEPAEIVILGSPAETLHDPAVAPDQSFIVFNSGKTKGGLGRLCIAFRDGDQWGVPVDLGDEVNQDMPWGAHVAPDGKSVYVTGQTGIHRIFLEPWLANQVRTQDRKSTNS